MNTENEIIVLKYDNDVIAVQKKDNEMNANSNEARAASYIWMIKCLLTAQILLMRETFPETEDSWYCGSAVIDDLSKCSNLRFAFGSMEDVESVKEDSDIFVEVPYDVVNDNIALIAANGMA